jgi:hypothetical protein
VYGEDFRRNVYGEDSEKCVCTVAVAKYGFGEMCMEWIRRNVYGEDFRRNVYGEDFRRNVYGVDSEKSVRTVA